MKLLPNIAVREREQNGVHEIDFDQGPMKPWEVPPQLLTSNEVVAPHIAFSTAKDWNTVATAYSEIVERHHKGFNAPACLPAFPAGATRDSKLLASAQKLNREIRYSGIEF